MKIPPSWESAPLEELVEISAPIRYGILQPGPDVPDGVPYIRPTEIKDDAVRVQDIRRTTHEIAAKYKNAALKSGDIVYSIVGTIGKLAFVPPELEGGNITQSSARVRPDGAIINPSYLFWQLKSPRFFSQVDALRLGTGVPRLNLGDFRKMEIVFPSVSEQRQVVSRIQLLSERSQASKVALDAIPPLLEKFRQSILAAAFRGDLTAEWRRQNPDVEPASVLLERIRAERRQRWEDAELAKMRAKGKEPKDDKWKAKLEDVEYDFLEDSWFLSRFSVPASWKLCSMSLIGDLTTGRTPSTSDPELWGPSIPFLTPSEIDGKGQIAEYRRFLTAKGATHSQIVPSGTTVIVCIGTVGKVGLVEGVTAFNQQLNAITPRPGVEPQYLFYWCKALYPWIVRNASATVNAAILNKGRLSAAPFLLPPLAEQRSIVSKIEESFSNVDSAAHRVRLCSKTLSALSQSILAKAFRGELVPQDPNDEPASVLLERIRAERAASPPTRKRKTRAE